MNIEQAKFIVEQLKAKKNMTKLEKDLFVKAISVLAGDGLKGL